MTQHRLVVLGSMDEFVELVKLARRQGIYTIVCDGYENGPAHHVGRSRVSVPPAGLEPASRSGRF